jgi:ADP-heptose:LPS heptosyltransferase
MGLGDNLLASGMARGAHARGKRIAFGDGKEILWDGNSEQIFRHNPNIAPKGSEGASDLEWIDFYKGSRHYNSHDKANNRWTWNYDFRPTPGEMYFTKEERLAGDRLGGGFVVIEPNLPRQKSSSPNKDWGVTNYQAVASWLLRRHYRVVQFQTGSKRLAGAWQVRTTSFRDALALMARASLYIGPEGGLHHGAAAVGIPAVVLFGGFIPPQVTGYDTHTNLTGGAEACGSLAPCNHCKEAMARIHVLTVYEAAHAHLRGAA